MGPDAAESHRQTSGRAQGSCAASARPDCTLPHGLPLSSAVAAKQSVAVLTRFRGEVPHYTNVLSICIRNTMTKRNLEDKGFIWLLFPYYSPSLGGSQGRSLEAETKANIVKKCSLSARRLALSLPPGPPFSGMASSAGGWGWALPNPSLLKKLLSGLAYSPF